MLKRLFQWLKNLISIFFPRKQTSSLKTNVTKTPPPLTDTDLEFLFHELLEGVNQAKGEAWAQKWLQNIENRVSSQEWVDWLHRLSQTLLTSSASHNELAVRLVQLRDLGLGELGSVAYEIGMQLLTSEEDDHIWEYDGPDAVNTLLNPPMDPENFPDEGISQTVTLDELFVMLQQNQDFRQQIAEQLSIETEDPQIIIQELINQHLSASSASVSMGEQN